MLSMPRRIHTMPDQPEKRESVCVEDLALSNAYQLEAMINVLERKGLLAKAQSVGGIEGDEH
jgi:hypothetical protein